MINILKPFIQPVYHPSHKNHPYYYMGMTLNVVLMKEILHLKYIDKRPIILFKQANLHFFHNFAEVSLLIIEYCVILIMLGNTDDIKMYYITNNVFF